MAASEAKIGYGAAFSMGATDEPSTTFTKFAEVTDLPLPEGTTDDIEVTHMESEDRQKEYIPGLRDGGDFQFEANWTRASYQQVKAVQDSGERRQFLLTLATVDGVGGDKWQFLGYPKGLGGNVPVSDKIKTSVTIKIAGKITYTPGT